MGGEPGLQSPLFDPVAIVSGAWGAKAFKALSGLISRGSVYEGMTVYRVYGDGAGAFGRSWTPVNPGTVANYRYAAGLPPQNSGRFIIQGTLNSTAGVTTRAALRIGSNAGGLPEILIPKASAQVDVLRVMGVNPPF